MTQRSDPNKPTYIGDGVYASWDGYHILLHVGAHTNRPVVALESTVLRNLDNYRAMIAEETRLGQQEDSVGVPNDAQVRGSDE